MIRGRQQQAEYRRQLDEIIQRRRFTDLMSIPAIAARLGIKKSAVIRSLWRSKHAKAGAADKAATDGRSRTGT